MAIVTRYFSTTGAGAADGTTWADRAALFSAGNWSTIISGFGFNGTDSLKCMVGPGTYTCGQILQTSLFTNAPTVANMLSFAGCDSSGNLLAVPDPDWISAMPAFDDSTLPVIATTGNLQTTTLQICSFYLIKFTASGRTGGVVLQSSTFDWCVLVNSTANASTQGVNACPITNSVISMTGSSYDAALVFAGHITSNVKLIGVTGSSGDRDGWLTAGNTSIVPVQRVCSTGFGGHGFVSTSATASHVMGFKSCTAANNGGDGFRFPGTASQSNWNFLIDCQATGNTGTGINPQGQAHLITHNCRVRDNGTNLGTFTNYPSDLNIYTTDSDDATEYVDTSTKDFRIKNTAATWGKNFGAGDQEAAGSGSVVIVGEDSSMDFRKHSVTSQIVRVRLRHATTGAGLTGLTSASTGLIISTLCDNEATATVYTVAASNVESITTLATYAAPTASKCRFKEVDATNEPGLYEIQLADARFAVSSARRLRISWTGATNLLTGSHTIVLVAFDPHDAVRMGMTSLPNAAADAAGGLPISDAGGLDMDGIAAAAAAATLAGVDTSSEAAAVLIAATQADPVGARLKPTRST